MSDQSPTIGELKREIEDLKARVDELDERAGLADEAEEYEDHTPSFVDEREDDLEGRLRRWYEWEREFRRRSTGGPR